MMMSLNTMRKMMTKLVFDSEGNGLYHECTKLWCIVSKDIDYPKDVQYSQPDEIEAGLDRLYEADTIIGHFILGYDLPVFRKLYGWIPRKGTRIIDTYVLSRLLNPDRKGHSIDYWGGVFGREKPEHEDWSRFTPEMLHRCVEDTEINYMVYKTLLKEIQNG